MEKVITEVTTRFGAQLIPGEEIGDIPTLIVAPEELTATCRFLREEATCRCEQLTDLTARDLHPRTPRFLLVYHLLSLTANRRLRLHVPLTGDNPVVDSVTSIWDGANWLEREAWDMFGIRFTGHPDLKRILMPEGYSLHPLRKDSPLRGDDPGQHYRAWDESREGDQA